MPGASKLDVRERCGEPDLVERVSGSDETLREAWLYRREQGVAKLEFEGVELRTIDRRAR